MTDKDKRKNLLEKTVDKLRDLAKKMGFGGASRATKSELVDAILQASRKASSRVVSGVAGGEKTRAKTRSKPAKTVAKADAPRKAADPAKPEDKKKKKSGPARVVKLSQLKKMKKKARVAKLAPRRPAARVRRPAPAAKPLVLPKAPPPLPREIPDPPVRYGEDRLVIMSRDPHWFFAYWELTPESWERAKRSVRGGAKLSLRVYELGAGGGKQYLRFEDIPLEESMVGTWYFRVWSEKATYQAEMGLLPADPDRFIPMVRSNPAGAPQAELSGSIAPSWNTSDADYREMFHIPQEQPGEPVPPLTTGVSSADIHQVLQRRLEATLSAGLVSSGGVSSLSGRPLAPGEAPGGGAAAGGSVPARGFWLNVHTDLILYGATEPDAAVQVQGIPVNLRKDGTFTLRFSLPDGRQELQVTAQSKDSSESRSITPIVERTTNGGDGGAHS
jgi:hypothetical protein